MPKVEPFEKNIGRYEEWFVRNRFTFESEIQAVKSLLPKVGTGIEIGVGTGQFAAPLSIKLGIDPSIAMMKVARKRGIKTIGGAAEVLPFKDNQFDFALMVTTICFVDDITKSLKEAYRIIKPQGFIIVGFVDLNSPLGQIYIRYKNENVFYKEANFFSADEVANYMKKTGFRWFSFVQTIFHGLGGINEVEPIMEGYGEGSFVVVRGQK